MFRTFVYIQVPRLDGQKCVTVSVTMSPRDFWDHKVFELVLFGQFAHPRAKPEGAAAAEK